MGISGQVLGAQSCLLQPDNLPSLPSAPLHWPHSRDWRKARSSLLPRTAPGLVQRLPVFQDHV